MRSRLLHDHDHDIITNIDHVKDLMTEIKQQQGPFSPIDTSSSSLPSTSSPSPSSPLALIAQKARHSLKLLSDKSKYECGNDNIFKPYDTHKKNVITYDDFKASLIRANANISNDATYNLASALDKNDTGIIQYDNILTALKTIEDNAIPSIEPITSSSSSSSLSTPTKSHILSNEAREILNKLRQEPYTVDETSIPYSSLSPNSGNSIRYENDNTDSIYPPQYENYIKAINPNYHEFLSHPRRHIKDIKGVQHDMYRPSPYHRDDLNGYDVFPQRSRNNKDNSYRPYRSRSAPPANQIKSLAFEETPTRKKKVSSPATPSSMSLYEHLMLAKNKSIGDYVTIEQKDNDLTTSPIIKDQSLSSSTSSSRKKTVINSLITQLKGKLMPLRIQLKKFDASNSGLVNMNEFVAALSSTGIVAPKKQLIELFNESSHFANDTSKGHLAVYEDERAVSIEDFISNMQKKTYNSHSHLISERDRNDNIKREDSRIFKKVLHATEKVGGDIHRYFIGQDADYHGWIQPNKLKDALKYLGANVNDDEFTKVVNKLDKNDHGLISVHQLDSALNRYVYDYDSHYYDHTMEDRSTHRRYSNTYKPQHYHNVNKSVNEYDEVRRAKLVRKERMHWAKLRNKLVTSNDVLNKVFASSADKQLDFLDRRIDVNDIQRSLARAGIQLGNDDSNRFKAYLQEFKRIKSKDNTVDNYVSAKELCEFLDPKVSYHKDIKSIDPDKIEDGGLFSTHLRVPSTDNKSLNSSFYLSDKFLEKSLGQKRKVKRDDLFNSSEPSRYWLLEHEKIIDPEFKYGPGPYVQRTAKSNSSNDKQIIEINGNNNSIITSSMLKQPYHHLLKKGVEHQYGRRNSSQKNSTSQESSELQGYKSFRKLRLPLPTDVLNDSVGSYHSSDSSKYDIQKWAQRSLADFMAAKQKFGLISSSIDNDEHSSKHTPRVRFEDSNSNIYLPSQVKSLRGTRKVSRESPI